MSEIPGGEDLVANKAAGTAVVIPAPEQGTVQFEIRLMAPGPTDHLRMVDSVGAFFRRTPILRCVGIDEGYRLHLVDEHLSGGLGEDAGLDGINMGRLVFRVENFRRWLKEPVDDFVVRRVALSIGNEAVSVLPRLPGTGRVC
jgi:hypothetical protein